MGFWNRLRHHFFDRPISRRERDFLLRLLSVALSETETDAGFEALMRQMLQQEDGLDTEHVWRWVLMHLEAYRGPMEFHAMPRTLAQRFLADPPLDWPDDGG